MVSVKNNEFVVDYPKFKLPKKLNVVLAREYEHEKPLELEGPFLFLENTHRVMIEEIAGFYEDDIKTIEEFMHAIRGNLIRDIMLGNFEFPDKVPPLTFLIKDPEENQVPTPITSNRDEETSYDIDAGSNQENAVSKQSCLFLWKKRSKIQ